MVMNEHAPVIVIGAARSGTKFLRNVLGSAKGVCTVPYDINYVWRYGVEDWPNDVLDPETLSAERIDYIRNTIYSLAHADPTDLIVEKTVSNTCLLYTSPSPRDGLLSRMPSSA